MLDLPARSTHRIITESARQAAPSHIITRWVHEPLRFVTTAPMTVPGKGGRPRKWRSDADRVRAFRAQARGEDEPPTIELALQYGDEAAAAWDQVRELGITIDALTAELKQTQATVRRAENELEREQARSSWLSEANDRPNRTRHRRTRTRRPAGATRRTRPDHIYRCTESPNHSWSEPSAAPAGGAQTASLAVTATTHSTTHSRPRE